MYGWYVLDLDSSGYPTNHFSTVNATMNWDGDLNYDSPLPTGTLTAAVYDSGCPDTGCTYTATITSADLEWDGPGLGWSLHHAFPLGTQYPSSDTVWITYSGGGTFAGSTGQAINT